MRLFRAGELGRARQMQWRLSHLAAMVTRLHGVGALKAAMNLAGFQGGQVRSPLTMPPPPVVEELEQLLDGLD
jgi:4-hydroxy-2-oxoglutarate aldolase